MAWGTDRVLSLMWHATPPPPFMCVCVCVLLLLLLFLFVCFVVAGSSIACAKYPFQILAEKNLPVDKFPPWLWQWSVIEEIDPFFPLLSSHTRVKLTPKNMRDLALLSHLMQGFSPTVTLTSAVPYTIPWNRFAIHVCHSPVPRRLVVDTLNASVVALCKADLSEVVFLCAVDSLCVCVCACI